MNTFPINLLFSDSTRVIFGADMPYLANDEINTKICFHLGLPDPLTFPLNEFQKLINSKTLNWDVAFQYSECAGVERLRKNILLLMKERGVEAGLKNIMITSGISEAYDLIPELFLNPSDIVFVEEPSYPWALRAFGIHRAKVIGVPLDKDGIDTEVLEKKIKQNRERAKLIYVMPNFHNPTGVTMSIERRKKLVWLAENYKIMIIEDDPYSNIRFEGQSLPSLYQLKNQYVIYLGSFSKTIGGGVRLGWLLALPEIIDKLNQIKHTGTTSFTSEIVSEYITLPEYIRGIERIQSLYCEKRNAVINSLNKNNLSKYLFSKPTGGFYIWLKVPDNINTETFVRECQNLGVYILAGNYFSSNPQMKQFYRISYSFESVDRIEKGVSLIANFYNK